ncbi:MAG: DNA-protecting protein DprA, partial [Pseudomonadota bacterium]
DAAKTDVEDSVLLRYLGHDASDIDTLCVRSGLTAEAVSAMLLALELDGVVANLPGGRYQRIR